MSIVSKVLRIRTKNMLSHSINLSSNQVKMLEAGTRGRSTRNEHTSKSLICTNLI